MNDLKQLIQQFMPFAQKQMGFSRPPKLFLRQDAENAANPLGKTGFYDPQAESITIYVSGRHPKDILRSLAHELMHHTQKCNGDFDNVESEGMGEQGYAQNNVHMRTMEIQAYQASIVFRDWEDSLKETIYYEHLQKGDKKMSLKDWRNRELTTLLSEAWGFGFKVDRLAEAEDPTGIESASEEGEKKAKKSLKGKDKGKEGMEELEEQGDVAWAAPGPFSGELPARRKCLDAGYESESVEYMRCMKKLGIKDPGAASLHGGGKIGPVRPGDLQEDSGEEEKRHYEHDSMHDDDHIKAIRHHLDALEHDEDYDEEHEELEEEIRGQKQSFLSPEQEEHERAEREEKEKEDKELEERRGRGRADPRNQRGPADPRQRPMEESRDKVQKMVNRIIRQLKETKKNG